MVQVKKTKYDGDTVSLRPVFTKEANAECEERIKSIAYILNIEGENMREMSRDFTLCCYNMTVPFGDLPMELVNINQKPAKYSI